MLSPFVYVSLPPLFLSLSFPHRQILSFAHFSVRCVSIVPFVLRSDISNGQNRRERQSLPQFSYILRTVRSLRRRGKGKSLWDECPKRSIRRRPNETNPSGKDTIIKWQMDN